MTGYAVGSTVTITRDQRDALHYEIRNYILDSGGYLGDFHSSLHIPGRGYDARERWVQISRAARILEAIGWDSTSGRETYTLSIDDALADLVRWRLHETESCIADHSETFAAVRAGRDPFVRYGRRGPDEGSLENDMDDLRAIVDVDLEVVGACRAVLNQLPAIPDDEDGES